MPDRSKNCPELPAPPGRIALFALLAFSAGSALAYGLKCSRHPQCSGYLAARTTHVICDREGTLSEFSVIAGDEVGLDDPLVQLTDTALKDEIAQKRQEITILTAELRRCSAEAELEVEWRTKALHAEICDIQLRSAGFLKERFNYQLRRTMLADLLQGDAIAMSNGSELLFESIVLGQGLPTNERASSMLELEAAANNAEVSSAQVEICDAQVKMLSQLLERIPDQVKRSVGVDVAEARAAQAEEELEQLLQRESRLTITSPAIGRVGVFQVKRGDHVVPGTPIVELLDASQRYLVVHVPSQQITNYTIDTRVRLIFPGNQGREGRVFSIAPQAVPQQTLPISVGNDTPVAVHVEQVGAVWPDVPVGSRVTVEIRD